MTKDSKITKEQQIKLTKRDLDERSGYIRILILVFKFVQVDKSKGSI